MVPSATDAHFDAKSTTLPNTTHAKLLLSRAKYNVCSLSNGGNDARNTHTIVCSFRVSSFAYTQYISHLKQSKTQEKTKTSAKSMAISFNRAARDGEKNTHDAENNV